MKSARKHHRGWIAASAGRPLDHNAFAPCLSPELGAEIVTPFVSHNSIPAATLPGPNAFVAAMAPQNYATQRSNLAKSIGLGQARKMAAPKRGRKPKASAPAAEWQTAFEAPKRQPFSASLYMIMSFIQYWRRIFYG